MSEINDSSERPTLWPSEAEEVHVKTTLPSPPAEQHVASYVVTWTAIAMIVAFHIGVALLSANLETKYEATAVDLIQVNTTAKLLVGQKKIVPAEQAVLSKVVVNKNDFPEKHMVESIIANEKEGPNAALARLDKARAEFKKVEVEFTANQTRLTDILTRLYSAYSEGDYRAEDVTADDRAFLKDKLGWSGKLALAPKQTADSACRKAVEDDATVFFVGTIIVGSMLMLMLVAGLAGLVILIVLFSIRTLKPRLESRRGGSHVFGETFAIWLILFNAIQISVELFVDGKYRLMAVGAGFFASLCALSWPIARGLTWTETREMIGWRLRSSMFLEAFWGVVSYVSFTPVLLIAVLMTSLLAQIGAGLGWTLFAQLDGKNAPSHPIVFELAKGDPLVLATVIFLACVAAPIIEETMFRGVLYRHLRGATASTRRWISVAFSAALNSFVFAAIHPQGVVAIPVLGTLAVAFSLVREWRESLIAPMVMHAMNNTIMVVMFLLVINSL